MDILRSESEKLVGKTILVIGTGGFGRKYIFENFADIGLKVILVHPQRERYISKTVHRFVEYDFEDTNIPVEDHANSIIQILGDTVNILNGCCAFADFYLYLASILCTKLGLDGFGPQTVRLVRSKAKTYRTLQASDDTKHYVASYVHIQNESDILHADGIIFPAILKPEYGTATGGVTKVFSIADCISKYRKLLSCHEVEWKTGGFPKSMVLMELLPALSYSVEVAMFDGCPIKSFVSVVSKCHVVNQTKPDEFADTVTCFSSCLPLNLRKKLMEAAEKCGRKLGLRHGVFNAEMKLTDSGFKLVEMNGRVSAYYHSCVFRSTHYTDLFVTQALISCGIRPNPSALQIRYAVGCVIYSSLHKSIISGDDFQATLDAISSDKKLYIQNQAGHNERGGNSLIIPFAHIVALDKTNVQSAREELISLFRKLELTKDEYDIEKMTEFCVHRMLC